MTIKVGDTIPAGTFKYVPYSSEITDKFSCGAPQPYKTDGWKGKKVLVVSVVGAFTGTCHSDHIPPFVKNRSLFQEKGIDVLAVVNANDFFVNNAWRGVQDVTDEIIFLSDPEAKWATELGLSTDLSGAGLGQRTGRWVMVLDDLKVTRLDVEPNPGEVTVTAADKVLKNL